MLEVAGSSLASSYDTSVKAVYGKTVRAVVCPAKADTFNGSELAPISTGPPGIALEA